MAILPSKIKIDLKIKHFAYFGEDAPMKKLTDKDLSLDEEYKFNNLSLKEAIKKLVEYIL